MHSNTYTNSYSHHPRTPMGGLIGPCYAKLLVSSSIAGSIIGKHGEEIANTEKNTGCTIRLSNSQSFFPGTTQRMCVVSGSLENILEAIEQILKKILKHTQIFGFQDTLPKGDVFNIDVGMLQDHNKMMCTIVVPKTAVSAIIGKGGQTIKATSESSGSKVIVSERENGLLERLVYFFGSFESVKKAVQKVLESIQDDSKIRESSLQLDYRNIQIQETTPIQAPPVAAYGYTPYSTENVSYPGIQPAFLNSQCEIYMHIPDSAMGAVIGKQGSCMTEIMRRTGTRIMVSQKGVLVPNTSNREVTIIGSMVAVHQAHAWLVQLYMSSLNEEQNTAYSNDPTLTGQAFRLARSRATLYNPYAQNP